MKPRSFLLDIFAIFFGISAWSSINGLWVELPLMVQVSISVKQFSVKNVLVIDLVNVSANTNNKDDN